ncbi:prolipoprotein diacylglyceryl transferase [Spiroplasma litorale]|uniref:Prolipoprotein diacylglyceryl transferase n=1 Tax=Spiroplasma litorale TaxID=216942 RepID=A0A0K1W0M5_9MOLU|nr:prolipoprotein diacylglyceryl transferase family protein [Spiroplasma litorale]AKX33728.1 prolipoprotein diacylglyceryl transferase [Spiroplasma litorale]
MINNFLSSKWSNGQPIPEGVFPRSDGRFSDNLSFLYSIFILAGVILVVIASIVCLRIKKIPLKEFINGIYISIPIAVIGASFFGKLGTTGEDWKIYRLFFFWEPGLSFFGGMFFGGTAAFVWFWYKKRVTKISIWVYADCIVPNVLLGQSIGRWGNLFNHEIMGKTVSDDNMNKITWLPTFIWHRLFYFRNPLTGQEYETLQFREPLFLYESIATFAFWLILVLLIPQLWKIFNKKPYKIDPYAFPCKFNKKVRWIDEKDLISYNTQIPVVYLKNSKGQLSLKMNWVWKKAYILYETNIQETKNLQNKITKRKEEQLKAEKNYKKINLEIKNKIKKIKRDNNNKELIKNIKSQKKSEEYINLKFQKSRIREFLGRDSKDLYNLNNPNKYFVWHSGVFASFYIMYISLIRILLDSFRDPYELAVKMHPALNYLSLFSIFLLGLVLFIFAQFISPKKWRESGWLYEKSY